MFTTDSGRAQPLLDDQIEPFLQHLRDAGYAERTLRKKRTVARAFARWAKRKGIATIDLNDGHVDAFVRRLPRGDKSRLKFELAAVRLFLGHLRATADLQGPASQAPVSPTASLLQQYENHLRKDRGLAENSLRVYLPLIRTFLASKLVNSGFPQSLKALTIQHFVIAQTRNRSAEYVRLLATALRSFCRFLSLRPSGSRPRSFRAQSLQIPPIYSARLSRAGRSNACSSGNRPVGAPGTSGLCHPAPPRKAWTARGRDRFVGTGRYLLADRRDRRPWEGPHGRALTPAAGDWRSLGRLPPQGSWRQSITTNLLANVGAAYRSDGAGGGGAHCSPGARASGDSPLRARRPPTCSATAWQRG